jgi:Domain of unknown function (DUF3576)
MGLAVAGTMLAACGGLTPDTNQTYPTKETKGRPEIVRGGNANKERDTVFGPGGLFGGGAKKREGEEGGVGIAVNSFLWRASLDTMAFMPLASADPFGGVIISEWYSPPDVPGERFKVTVYILDRALRADGIRVAVFRQVRRGDQWADESVSVNTPTNLENAILARARELRVAAQGL